MLEETPGISPEQGEQRLVLLDDPLSEQHGSRIAQLAELTKCARARHHNEQVSDDLRVGAWIWISQHVIVARTR